MDTKIIIERTVLYIALGFKKSVPGQTRNKLIIEIHIKSVDYVSNKNM
jgi:hypothetical protein